MNLFIVSALTVSALLLYTPEIIANPIERRLNQTVESGSAQNTPPSIWTSEPFCNQNSGNVLACKYSHTNERGIFILKQPNKLSFANYLVCTQSADETSGLFASGYAIKSRCELSSVHWQSYANLDPSQEMRSDVKGLLNWTNQTTNSRPISMPQLLADQCATAFPEALYCTPTLMVLPTKTDEKVDVCGLQTEKWALGAVVISITSASSKWVCTQFDLSNTVTENNLSYAEAQCIPNANSEYDSSCDLPYIPRTQEKIRVQNLKF
jgi:hypothetical protein